MRIVSVALPEETISAIRALIPEVKANPPVGAGRISRSYVHRLALEKGLAVLAKESARRAEQE